MLEFHAFNSMAVPEALRFFLTTTTIIMIIAAIKAAPPTATTTAMMRVLLFFFFDVDPLSLFPESPVTTLAVEEETPLVPCNPEVATMLEVTEDEDGDEVT